MNDALKNVEGEKMMGSGDNGSAPGNERGKKGPGNELPTVSVSDLRARAHQLSLREQLYANHLLFQHSYAASARLIQALEQGDVLEAIGEIIGNLIGSEEVAIFLRHTADGSLSVAWSTGVPPDVLHELSSTTDLIEHATRRRATQLEGRQFEAPPLPHEDKVTAFVPLKSGREVIGVIVILGLLPQKKGLEWVNYELLKFLETYGAVAIELQSLQSGVVNP